LYVDASENYLTENKSEILKQSKIKKINFDDDKIISIELDGGKILTFDYYISAVPFFDFENLFGDNILNGEYKNIKNLTPSPILNVHFQFDEIDGLEIEENDFAGILNSTIQWVFRINKNRICIVISSAKNLIEKDKNELLKICRKELTDCMPGFINAEFNYSRVVKEKRATFLPNTVSLKSRPGSKTKFKNLFIAGDWINTGYPATIESAVTSGKNCVEEIIKIIKK
jgi:protoporphyrinogen oxidase